MENEFFTDPTNIIIRHLNKDFPEITRSPGPLAFSEEKYINEILSNSGFKNIKVEKVYSLITTNDSPEKNGELLLSIGLGGRLLADANLSKKELSVIRDEMVEISQKRQKNGKITYKACLNYVSATK
tara:strand:- start:134 stop:514 length:381 start_codon:yes stop_codon:yes gene_type:complete